MPERPHVLTTTEYDALNLLFDAAQCVLGTEEYRLVDPVGKVAPMFPSREGAERFVDKLVRCQLLVLALVRPGPDADEVGVLRTYTVAMKLWPDFASSAKRVPDPPFDDDERRLRRAVESKRTRKEELLARKAELEREIKAIDGDIAALEGDLAAAEKLVKEVDDIRARIAALVEDAA